VKGDIALALQLRDQAPGSFKLVYVWTVISTSHMQFYLNMGVDGMITGNVASLNSLLNTKYVDQYVLATQDDFPFA
jgi:TM2 domain-containing membrane protein YozV